MITVATAQLLLTKHYPGHTLLSVKHAGAGRQWDVFKVEWDTNQGLIMCGPSWPSIIALRLKVKVPGEPDPRSSYPFCGHHIGTPQHCCSFTDDAYWCEVLYWIEGVSVHEHHEGNPLRPLTTQFGYLPSLVSRLRTLHSAAVPETGAPPFTTSWWVDKVEAIHKDAVLYLIDTVGLSVWHGDLLGCDHLRYLLMDQAPVRTSLLHGDLSNTNILLDASNPAVVSGILDWDTAHCGDYLWDLANWATFNEGAPEHIDRMLRLYHGLPDSGHDLDVHHDLWRRFWIYFVIIAMQKAVSLHRLGTYPDLTRAEKRIKLGLSHLS